jgi:HSP20 family protein
MANEKRERKNLVTRDYWSPNSIIEEMERVFDDFRGMRDLWLPSIGIRAHRVPMMDIRDSGNSYIMEAEFPGMSKEDVEIEIVEGGLRVSAKKEEAVEEKKEGYIRRERGALSFVRQLPLPEDSDTDGIKARMENGVLHMDIPKKQKTEERKKLVEVE